MSLALSFTSSSDASALYFLSRFEKSKVMEEDEDQLCLGASF